MRTTSTAPNSHPPELLPVHEEALKLLGSSRVILECEVAESNKRLRLNEAIERSQSEKDPLRQLLTRMRCEVFHKSGAEYGEFIGTDTQTVYRLELDHPLRPDLFTARTLHSLVSGWLRQAKSPDFKTRREVIVKAAAAVEELAAAKLGNPCAALLYRWMVRVGPDQVIKKGNITANYIGDKERLGWAPPLSFLLARARMIGVLAPKARPDSKEYREIEEVWSRHSVASGYPQPLVELHRALTRAGALDEKGRVRAPTEMQLSPAVAIGLRSFRGVPYESVERCVDQLIRQGHLSTTASKFESSWRVQVRPGFEEIVEERIERSGMSYVQLRELLPLAPTGKPVLRTLSRALARGSVRGELTSGLLAYFVADSQAEADSLIEMKRDRLRMDMRQRGVTPSTAVLDRRIWNIKIADLPGTRVEQRAYDRGKGDETARGAIAHAVSSEIARKRDTRVAEWVKMASYENVSELFEFFERRFGQHGARTALNLDTSAITPIQNGTETPGFPVIARSVLIIGDTPKPALINDWLDRTGKMLVVSGIGDLERVFRASMLMVAPNEVAFVKMQRLEKHDLNHILLRLRQTGTLPEHLFTVALKRFNIPESALPFVQAVWRTGSIVTALREIGAKPVPPTETTEPLDTVAAWFEVCHRVQKPLRSVTEEQVTECCRSFVGAIQVPLARYPGATSEELVASLSTDPDPRKDFADLILRRVNRIGVATELLADALSTSGEDHLHFQLELATRALTIGTFGTGVSMASLCKVAGKDLSEFDGLMSLARSAISSVLIRAGVPGLHGVVEMTVQGVRSDRIGHRGRTAVRYLADPDQQRAISDETRSLGGVHSDIVAKRLVALISEERVGTRKKRQIASPISEGVRTDTLLAPFTRSRIEAASARASEPSVTPPASGMNRILRVNDAIANRAPFTRVIFSLAAGSPDFIQPALSGDIDPALSRFVILKLRSKVGEPSQREHLSDTLLRDSVPSPADILKLFKIFALPMQGHLVALLTGAGQTPRALAESFLRTETAGVTRAAVAECIARLPGFLTDGGGSTTVERSDKIHLAIGGEWNSSLTSILPALTVAEWRELGAVAAELKTWTITPLEVRLSVEERFRLLATRERQRMCITPEHLRQLFSEPEIRDMFDRLERTRPDQAVWYAASAGWFDGAEAAMKRFANRVAGGTSARDPFADFNRFSEWGQSRVSKELGLVPLMQLDRLLE